VTRFFNFTPTLLRITRIASTVRPWRPITFHRSLGWTRNSNYDNLLTFDRTDLNLVGVMHERLCNRLYQVLHRPSLCARRSTEQVEGANEEFFAALRQQIERWCDQRRLRELAVLLPGYTSFFGLTDDWARLYEALQDTRAIGREKFSLAEWELLNDLISAAERAVYRR
jgi:hypothetical protein